MDGKPYHKIPVTSWIVPGGNRARKKQFVQAQQYPMKSAIQQNLGGPLSEVFFSNLTSTQKDNMGYTPSLKGPGTDLWVSPSDNLIGKVILKPPFSLKVRQAMTHQGILHIGAEIEERVNKAKEKEMEEILQEKIAELMEIMDEKIKQAIILDRQAKEYVDRRILLATQQNFALVYRNILMTTVNELLNESIRRMEEAVMSTRQYMEQQLCKAVESHSEHLGRQYEFQLALRENELSDKYENLLKKQGQKCTQEIERITEEYKVQLLRAIVKLEAEQDTALLVQACEKSQKHHEEKKHLEHNFGSWFIQKFETEIVDRDFRILELENILRKMKDESNKREEQLRDIYRHFQKFINYVFKEKPGQAEFLLNLEKEIKAMYPKEKDPEDNKFIAQLLLDYILKNISDKSDKMIEIPEEEKPKQPIDTKELREKISNDREKNRILTVVGENEKTPPSEKSAFQIGEIQSLLNIFQKNPSVIEILNSIKSSIPSDPEQNLQN